jgi:hypothetical protein
LTDPEHERRFDEAMLPGGTEPFYLYPRKLSGLAAQIKNLCPEYRRHQRNPRFPELGTFDCAFAAP